MLSKETTDQIRKEADEHIDRIYDYPLVIENDASAINRKLGYIAGATAWAVWKQKAEGAMEALEKCKPFIEDMQKENYNEPGAGISYDNKLEDAFNSLAKALEQLK